MCEFKKNSTKEVKIEGITSQQTFCVVQFKEKENNPKQYLTWAFMGWQMAMYLSMVKAVRESAEAFMARNWA